MYAYRQLEHSISIYEGDDPLDLYCDYFTWLEQNVAILGTNSYIRLLEDIIIKFKDWETYKQDARFIQLIIKYVRRFTVTLLSAVELEYYSPLKKFMFRSVRSQIRWNYTS